MDAMPEVLASVTSEALAVLCRQFRVRRLDLFGSAADGRFDPARSDLDFLVSFEAPGTRHYADCYFGLRDGLIALFGREVDLVTESSLENPFFRRRVEAQRKQVFPEP